MLIKSGLLLMVIGMTVVFSFLILLVVAMQASAAFFRQFADLFKEEPAPSTKTERVVEDHSEIAVVLAAIKAYTKG